MIRVVFACVQNAGRSQMAAALFNAVADAAKAQAISAGTRPAARVHPEVVEAMREVGIDLSSAVPRLLTEGLVSDAQVLVTMGCGEECPIAPRVRRIDWAIPDPKGLPIEQVRRIRDEIGAKVRQLAHELAPEGTA